jgi:protein SCO1/2
VTALRPLPLLVLALALAAAPSARAVDESLYVLTPALTAQDGTPFAFASLRGHPVLLAMFYAGCTSACPLLVSDVAALERSLPPALRGELRVLLVSFDPDRDTPAKLEEMAAAHHLDPTRWTLARAPENDVRTLAAVLGTKYVRLANGDFAHSSVIALLDRHGVLKAKVDGVGEETRVLVAPLLEAAQSKP